MIWQKRIDLSLEKRRKTSTLRSRTVVNSIGRFLIYNGKSYYNFSCNDYLGLRRHPEVVRAWKKGAEYYGVGSGGSGHISGYTLAHNRFEKELSEWLGYPDALLFMSGFAANQAVIFALTTKKDRIIVDRLSHASILEAAHLSLAQLRRFHHNDLESLKYLLQKPCFGQRLVITEGVFSMDGDKAPLNDLFVITKELGAWLMVDDAHGFGVVGESGKGSCDIQRVKPELLIVTFGKGAGVCGAAVLCSKDVADYLLQYASHLIYSTSMPPAQAMALSASLNIIRSDEGEEKRQKLAQNIKQFRKGISQLGMQFLNSKTAIQPLIVGKSLDAQSLTKRLRNRGIWTVAIFPPTVPTNTARLRLTFSAEHEEVDITALLEALYDETNK